MTDLQSIMPFAATFTALGGAWLTLRKIARDAHKTKKEQAQEILKAAREEDLIMKTKLEARIEGLKADLKNLEFNVNKDMGHLKENYSSEIRVLGEKIEELREQLHNQHVGVLNLLSKLVDKR